MPQLYPLRFQPVFRRYIWGGRRLADELGKPIGDEDCAESWEIVDHGEDQTHVAAGPLEGASLRQLVEQHGDDLFGRHAPQKQFPLLFKFLDCNRNLSVQVHPDDERAAQLDPPDNGKTEAWYVIDADPGSVLYAGLKRGFDRAALERESNRGATELCLQEIEPQAGDCVFIPAGIVHALGAGMLVAEIQQASDTTYRLYDWNRVGADGQPRQLHVEQALECIDYKSGPRSAQHPKATQREGVERLVECDKFVLDRCKITEPLNIGGDNRFHIVAVIEGEVSLSGDPAGQPLKRGQTALLPACCEAEAKPNGAAVMLDMYLPD